jgi:hypothetical protein
MTNPEIMQILFISEEAQVLNFLSGLQAEAIVPAQSRVEITGLSEDSVVTVICSGESSHYAATITKIDSGYQHMTREGIWLGVKIMVRRNNSMLNYDFERSVLND